VRCPHMHAPTPTTHQNPDARKFPERMNYQVTREVVRDELQRYFGDMLAQELKELSSRVQQDIRDELHTFLGDWSTGDRIVHDPAVQPLFAHNVGQRPTSATLSGSPSNETHGSPKGQAWQIPSKSQKLLRLPGAIDDKDSDDSVIAERKSKPSQTSRRSTGYDITTTLSPFARRRRSYHRSPSRSLSATARLWRSPIRTIKSWVGSVYFDYLMGVLLISNAVEIGIQVDIMASRSDDTIPLEFRIIDWVYCIIFTAELLLRICVYRREFLRMAGWKCNLFDTIVVAFQIVDESTKLLFTGTKFQELIDSMGVLRVLQLGRVVRLVRMVRLIPELKSMVYLIMASMGSCFWTMILLMIMLYCAAVYFTELATELVRGQSDFDNEKVDLHWGCIFNSIITLFQAITGGDDWKNFVESVTTQSTRSVNMVLFMIYISFATLVMLNLVTGVFVEGAQRIIKEDRDNEISTHVRKLFFFADGDHSGDISLAEFQEAMELGEFEIFAQVAELGATTSARLFDMLDTDQSGTLSVEEFVDGCIRLRGHAKASDLLALKFDFALACRTWQEEHMNSLAQHTRTHELLQRLVDMVGRVSIFSLRDQASTVLV